MNFDIFYIANIIGTIAFAISGFAAGARKNLDIMGLFILAMSTANGGGMVRDILVNKVPVMLVDITPFFYCNCNYLCFLPFKIPHQKKSGREIYLCN